MNEIFQNLIDADARARKLYEDAEAYLKNTHDTIDEQKAKFIEGYRARALERIAKVKEESGESYGETMKTIEEKYQALFDKLEGTYTENHAKWEEDLFARCIK